MFTILSLNQVTLHSRFWLPRLQFLTPLTVKTFNDQITKLNQVLSKPPTRTHHSLYQTLSETSFWQQRAEQFNAPTSVKEKLSKIRADFEQSKAFLFCDAPALLLLIDSLIPYLREFIIHGKKECVEYEKWGHSLQYRFNPYARNYFSAINTLHAQLNQAEQTLLLLENSLEWTISAKLKLLKAANAPIARYEDLLHSFAMELNSLIPQADIDVSFKPLAALNTDCIMHFATYLREERQIAEPIIASLIPPHLCNDKVRSILSSIESKQRYEQVLLDNATLKESLSSQLFRILIVPTTPTLWQRLRHQFTYSTSTFLYYAFTFLVPPIVMTLYWIGLMSFYVAALLLTGWFIRHTLWNMVTFANLALLTIFSMWDKFRGHPQRVHIVFHTNSLALIEQSVIFLRRRIWVGTHKTVDFDAQSIQPSYHLLTQQLEEQKRYLLRLKPHWYTVWRHPTAVLIDNLITKISLQQESLKKGMADFAEDLANRIQLDIKRLQLVPSQNPTIAPKLPKEILFNLFHFTKSFGSDSTIERFINNCRIPDIFLKPLCNVTEGALTQPYKSPISSTNAQNSVFHTHKVNTLSLDIAAQYVEHFELAPEKLLALKTIKKLLSYEQIPSRNELLENCAQLASEEFSAKEIMRGIQNHLVATFKGQPPEVLELLSHEQREMCNRWITHHKGKIEQVLQSLKPLLQLPLDADFAIANITPFPFPIDYCCYLLDMHQANCYLSKTSPTITRNHLQTKLIDLAPYYSGKPTPIISLIPHLWSMPPIILKERIIELRFSWALDQFFNTHSLLRNSEMEQLTNELAVDLNIHLTDVENCLRENWIFATHPVFYSQWKQEIEQFLNSLSQRGLFFKQGVQMYRRKALNELLTPTTHLSETNNPSLIKIRQEY